MRPNRRIAFRHYGHRHYIAKHFIVTLRHAVACGDLIREYLQLLDQDRSLHGVKTAIHADANIVVFIAALAMDTEGPHDGGQFIIIGENRPPIAIATKRLGREKAGGGRRAYGAKLAATIACAEALCRITQNPQILTCANRFNLVVIRRLTKKIHGYDAHRLKAKLTRRVDTEFQAGWIHVEGLRQAIHEDRHCPKPGNNLGCRGEGKAWA